MELDDRLLRLEEVIRLAGKRHDNVRVDIEKMADELSLTFQEKAEPSTGGRPNELTADEIRRQSLEAVFPPQTPKGIMQIIERHVEARVMGIMA